jgi:hypothetical protein
MPVIRNPEMTKGINAYEPAADPREARVVKHDDSNRDRSQGLYVGPEPAG